MPRNNQFSVFTQKKIKYYPEKNLPKFLKKLPNKTKCIYILTVTPTDTRPINYPVILFYSPKPQQSVRQRRQFANDNEANDHKTIVHLYLHLCDNRID